MSKKLNRVLLIVLSLFLFSFTFIFSSFTPQLFSASASPLLTEYIRIGYNDGLHSKLGVRNANELQQIEFGKQDDIIPTPILNYYVQRHNNDGTGKTLYFPHCNTRMTFNKAFTGQSTLYTYFSSFEQDYFSIADFGGYMYDCTLQDVYYNTLLPLIVPIDETKIPRDYTYELNYDSTVATGNLTIDMLGFLDPRKTENFSIFIASNDYKSIREYHLGESFNFYNNDIPVFYILIRGMVMNSNDRILTPSYQFMLTRYDADYSTGDYSASYNQGFNEGKKQGIDEGYSNGYGVGYGVGLSEASNDKYNQGYNDGIEHYNELFGGQNMFLSMFTAIADVSVKTIDGMFNFDIFGINIKVLLLTALTVSFALFIIRLLKR